MNPKTALLAFPLATAMLAAPAAFAAGPYYWDGNNTSAGYGSASGSWLAPTPGPTPGWGAANGTTAVASVTTATTDALNFGNGATGLGAGTITVGTVSGGNITFASGSGAIVLSSGTITLAATQTTTVDNTTDTINSILAGAATSFTKADKGILALTGANSYTGATIISGGTLDLGGGTATGSLASTVLTLSGGALNYSVTGPSTQSFTTTNINAGAAAQISVTAGNILNLGTVTRGAGGVLDFSSTGAGTVAALTASNDTSGIMPGLNYGDTWAVANGADVATSGLPGASYTLTSVAGATSINYTGFNIDVDNNAGPLDAPITANSVRFSATAANTMALTGTTNVITSGGILVGSAVGGNLSTIAGGTLAGANTKDLSIIQNNTSGDLTISASIANNTGTTALIKSGAGVLNLSGNNTFTGGLTINAGKVALGNAGALFNTAGSENNVTFGVGTSGTLAINGNSVIVRSLNTNSLNAGSVIVENANSTPATLTIGNAGNAASTVAGVIRDGTGGGALALAKAGTGTLTLPIANTYSGGTTLSAGTVVISNATSLGTGNVTVSGASQITATNGITYANAIAVNAGLSLKISATGTATYSGVLSGSSPITIVSAGLGGANTGTHAFTNTGNNFTGNVILPSATGSSEEFSFASIGDGGNFTFARPSWREAVIYTGAANITFNSRQIALASTIANASGVDGNGKPSNQFQNNGTGTVTFNTAMSLPASTAASTYFTFAGSNTGNNTFAGIIGTPGGTNTLSIAKFDGGKWILSNTGNFYTGNTWIANGTLSAPAIDVKANAQPFGKGSLILLGNQGTNGILEYTGATTSITDKQVQIGISSATQTSAGSILNDGTGSLTFSNATFNPTISGITVTRTLTLGGSYNGGSGANEIQGVIQNNAAAGLVALTVSGSTWKLSGTNSYTGATTVNGGTLLINGNQSTATGAVAVNGTSTLGGTGTIGGSVTVAAGANLAPGASVGTLSILGGLNISAPANGGTGKLKFDLGPIAASDKIAVTGTLTIGSGVLDFSDFAFTALTGLEVGTYKLITSGGISGTLDPTPADLTGAIGGFTGTLQLNGNDLELVVAASGGYAPWAAINAPTGTVYDDYDGDGVSNGLEYVLGGTALTNDLSKLPTVSTSGGNLVFTFERDQQSIKPDTTVVIEVGTDLVTWPGSYPVPDSATGPVNPGVTVVKDSPVAGKDTVTLTIPQTPDTVKFARLKVVVTTP